MDLEKYIVYADMVGDLFHWGHVDLLKRAKQIATQNAKQNQKSILMVGVHDDIDVQKYKRNPIMKMNERIKVIEGCKYVDEIFPKAPLVITPNFIEENKIDLVIHAHPENESEKYNKMYQNAINLNKFKRLDYTSNISTTDIIERLRLYHA